MKTPAVPIAVLALLLGCQTEQQSPPAGASPAAGTAGAATGGGGSGGGTPNTGGASGSAGADAGGSASYSAPEWAALGDVASCTVFRIANPELVKPVLSWSSCGDGCKDSAQIHTWGRFESEPRISGSHVRGNGGKTFVGLQISSGDETLAVVVDRDGSVHQAVRAEPLEPSATCPVGGVSIWNEQFGVNMARFTRSPTALAENFVALLPATGDAGVRLGSIGLAGQVPQSLTLGEKFWVGDIAFAASIVSVDLKDFSHTILVPPVAPPLAGRGFRAGCGDSFLYEEHVRVGETIWPSIHYTDGQSPGAPYLTAPDVAFGSVACADTHVAFLRGTEATGRDEFGKVEVWVSPYSATASGLAPKFLAATTGNVVKNARNVVAGGYGRMAIREDAASLRVWDLETGAETHWTPDGVEFGALLGLTETDVWVATRRIGTNESTGVRRYEL